MAASRTTESPAKGHSFDSGHGTIAQDADETVASQSDVIEHDDDKPSGVHQVSTSPRTTSDFEIAGEAPLRKAWEIVEEFDHEGHRYRLQRRRISATKGSPLARREEETLELASVGMNRKQIAKRLGLAPSTVGVLLHRASIKLRARSRNELLSSYRELTEKTRTNQ